MAQAAKKPVSRRQMTKPLLMAQLMDTIGATQTAARVGVSTTLLHKARKDGEVNRVVELACGHVLEHLADQAQLPVRAAPKEAPPAPAAHGTLFMLEVSADKAPMVERMAAALGAELVSA